MPSPTQLQTHTHIIQARVNGLQHSYPGRMEVRPVIHRSHPRVTHPKYWVGHWNRPARGGRSILSYSSIRSSSSLPLLLLLPLAAPAPHVAERLCSPRPLLGCSSYSRLLVVFEPFASATALQPLIPLWMLLLLPVACCFRALCLGDGSVAPDPSLAAPHAPGCLLFLSHLPRRRLCSPLPLFGRSGTPGCLLFSSPLPRRRLYSPLPLFGRSGTPGRLLFSSPLPRRRLCSPLPLFGWSGTPGRLLFSGTPDRLLFSSTLPQRRCCEHLPCSPSAWIQCEEKSYPCAGLFGITGGYYKLTAHYCA